MADRHLLVTSDGPKSPYFTAAVKEGSLVIDMKKFLCRANNTDRLALQIEDWAKSHGVDIDYDRTD